jgi:hypothetical protein
MQHSSRRCLVTLGHSNSSSCDQNDWAALKAQPPLGFQAGDTNLYRYVGNDPTNATDPSGLAENPDDIYYNKVIQYNFDKDFSFSERRDIEQATSRAFRKLQKALSMLETHWKVLKHLSTTHRPDKPDKIDEKYKILDSEAKRYIERDHATIPERVNVRQYYIDKINEIFAEIDPKNDKAIGFVPNRSDKAKLEGPTYIRYYFTPSGETIHVTNLFFLLTPDDRADKIVHELARRVGFTDKENTGDPLYDAYTFEYVIHFLARQWDTLK